MAKAWRRYISIYCLVNLILCDSYDNLVKGSQFRVYMGISGASSAKVAASALMGSSWMISGLFQPKYPLGNIGAAIDAISKDIQSITCSLDNQNIDDFHGPCQQLDNIVRFRAGKAITIRQDWGSSSSTGAAVWNGANMAAWYMENEVPRKEWEGAKVVELGSGVGFTSIVAKFLGATDVTITDGNKEVLALANDNIDLNVASSQRGEIRTQQLRWSTSDETPFIESAREKPIKFIIAADCTYKKAAWPQLLGTIARLSSPGVTKTFMSMEPRNIGEVEGLLAEAQKQGLQVIERQLPVDPVKSQCNLLCARLFELTKAT